jgi:hydrogenase maturation protease
MSWPHPIRVVGVGSPLGDDALAWEVVRILRERPALQPGTEVYLVEGGQRLLDVLDGRGTLLLVDAVASDMKPGSIHRFEWPDQRIEALRPGSTHDLRPAEALRLAEVLGIAPSRVIVFGMEMENFGPLPGLSQSVMAALPDLVGRLMQELVRSLTVDGKSPEPVGEEH